MKSDTPVSDRTPFDDDGYERRKCVMAVADCPVCGKQVELVAETEGWTQEADGLWHHMDYGPAMGVCCDRLIADWFDGCFVYDLNKK